MYLAVDIGATKTLLAVFSARGRVVRRVQFPTAMERTNFVNDLVKNLGELMGVGSSRDLRPRILAVTVAVPGHVRFSPDNVQSEQKICSVNFGNRKWGWFDLSTPLSKLFSCPIYFENDANLASVYESRGLRGKTMFLTFSTGIGGGIAENGRLLVTDVDDFEPGHVICKYGDETAEWEDIAAASALEKAYGVAQATDLRGRETMMDVAARIGLGLPSLVAKYQPRTIIIGGPMGKIYGRFSKYLPSLSVKYRRPKRPLESVIYGCYFFGKNQK